MGATVENAPGARSYLSNSFSIDEVFLRIILQGENFYTVGAEGVTKVGQSVFLFGASVRKFLIAGCTCNLKT